MRFLGNVKLADVVEKPCIVMDDRKEVIKVIENKGIKVWTTARTVMDDMDWVRAKEDKMKGDDYYSNGDCTDSPN